MIFPTDIYHLHNQDKYSIFLSVIELYWFPEAIKKATQIPQVTAAENTYWPRELTAGDTPQQMH